VVNVPDKPWHVSDSSSRCAPIARHNTRRNRGMWYNWAMCYGRTAQIDRARLASGYRLLLWFYTVLFVFVLPFICWGAWGMPSHAHAHPHIAFTPPHETRSDTSLTHHQHTPHCTDCPPEITGRSAADLAVASSFFLLTLLGGWIVYSVSPFFEFRFCADCLGTSYKSRVPTPPPRHYLCLLAQHITTVFPRAFSN